MDSSRDADAVASYNYYHQYQHRLLFMLLLHTCMYLNFKRKRLSAKRSIENQNKGVKKKAKKRKIWVREIFQKSFEQGAQYTLIEEMRLQDREKHFNYFRMSKELFDVLLAKVGPRLTKNSKNRDPIPAAERLSITLRYLASGDSMVSLSYAFRMGKSTVTNVIRETCKAIWDELNEEVLAFPDRKNFEEISEDFQSKWQLPNCIGAIDGKHVVTQAFPNSGSSFFNYKKSHSLVLLAMCNAKYQFTMVDIGAKGKQSDGGVFRRSVFGRQLFGNKLKLPNPSPVEYGGENIPFYIACDEAFPLTLNTMRPYPGHYLTRMKRIFNYRLSRARRVIENAFGILCSRWRILRKPIIASIETVEAIIQATVCLHNFIMQHEEKCGSKLYCSPNLVDRENEDGSLVEGQWREEARAEGLGDAPNLGTNTHTKDAAKMRDNLALYFMSEGAVDFQWNK